MGVVILIKQNDTYSFVCEVYVDVWVYDCAGVRACVCVSGVSIMFIMLIKQTFMYFDF